MKQFFTDLIHGKSRETDSGVENNGEQKVNNYVLNEIKWGQFGDTQKLKNQIEPCIEPNFLNIYGWYR